MYYLSVFLFFDDDFTVDWVLIGLAIDYAGNYAFVHALRYQFLTYVLELYAVGLLDIICIDVLIMFFVSFRLVGDGLIAIYQHLHLHRIEVVQERLGNWMFSLHLLLGHLALSNDLRT